MQEAQQVHTDLLSAAQDPKKFLKLEHDDPHEEAEDQKMLRLGYKYKTFKLSDEVTVCIRSVNHFYNESPTEGLSNLFVLLEWNQKRQGWTKDLDQMMMVMFNKEITDNASKFNKWTIQSIIAGVDKMRFAFVQRMDPLSTKSHKVVGFTSVNPVSFAGQLNLNVANCWAVLADFASTVLSQELASAEYLYMKDPVQHNYKLYHMVKTDHDEEDDDEEDEGL